MAALLACLPLPALTPPALAASSEWIGTKGGKLRLLVLPPDAQGTMRGVIEIAPEDGWHTYWKVPGSGGIPPQVTLKDGGNAQLQALDFPAPRIFDDGNLRDFGYDTRVMLPLTLKQETPGQPSTIDASIFIGLCSDICVPFQAEVTVKVAPDDKPKPAEAALVNAAAALLPEAPSADFSVEQARMTADGTAVNLRLKLPAGTDPTSATVIVIGPDGQPLGKPQQSSTTDGILVVWTKLPASLAGSMVGKKVSVLALAGGRAMETLAAVE